MNICWQTITSGLRFKSVAGLSLGCALLSVYIGSGLLPAGRASEESEPKATTSSSTTSTQLMREGTRIVEQLATCRSSGDQLMIELAVEGGPLAALENLAAQRILKAVMDDAGDEKWIITGQITEFQGHNYILLNQVKRQAKPRPIATEKN